ncbi:MAG TPA: flotillin-like FloA family protein, partial [Clostridia bacterium]|nr:flotillin-like FloA family protein [Clostridia bacterium]
LIPKAMAKAFEEGNLGVLDYYNMRNVMADTKMRESISEAGKTAKPQAAKKDK